MEFLESEYLATRGKKPRDDARRALLATSSATLDLAEKIKKRLKDPESIDDILDKCISGRMIQPWKELCDLAAAVGEIKAIFNDARRAEEKRTVREEKKANKAAAQAISAPVVNVIVNNYTNAAAPHVGGNVQPQSNDTRISHVSGEDPSSNPIVKAPKPTKEKPPKKAKITLAMREQIWKTYIGREIDASCPVCQTRVISMTDFSAGHIVAESTGGTTDITNLVPICCNCNSRMSTENLYEYTQKNYMRAPVFPVKPAPALPTTVPVPRHDTVVIKYEHCRAISGSQIDKKKCASDDEAIEYAKSKNYTGVTHKAGSSEMYYFADKSLKYKVAADESKGAWGFTSWEIRY